MSASEKTTTLAQMQAASMRSLQAAGEVAQAAAEAIQEVIDVIKADKAAFIPAAVPVSAWKANEDAELVGEGYAYCADIEIPGLTAADAVETVLDVPSQSVAYESGMCPVNDTLDGTVRFYAVSIPQREITMQLRIIYGAVAESEETA